MEANGWHFGWSDNNTFLILPNSRYCGGVPTTSYCGYQSPGDALLSLALVGSGSGTLDFGNSWTNGTVWAHLNGEFLGSADPGNLSVVVNFTFGYGDDIEITETGDGVNVINSLSFTCPSDRPIRRWLTGMTAGNFRICDDVTVCSSTQYQLSAATPTSDTVCTPISSCLPGLQHQTSAATATTDAVCASNTPCTLITPTSSTIALTTPRSSFTPAPSRTSSPTLMSPNAQVCCRSRAQMCRSTWSRISYTSMRVSIVR
jgi:hypothetical protein